VIPSLLLVGLLVGLCLGIRAAAAYLRRPIPGGHLLVLLLSSCGLLLPGILTDRTIVPVDHLLAIPPWTSLGYPKPVNPYLSDVVTQFVPWAKAVRQAWKSGSPPFLDPWNGCGTPLAANSQSAALAPLTFLSFLLPLARAFTWLAAARLFLAASGMWLWARECGASRNAALLAGISLSLSLAFIPLLLFPHTGVMCFWPWALFAYELIRREAEALRPMGAMAGIVLLMALGGHPESAASGLLLVTVWAAGRTFIGGPGGGGPGAFVRTGGAMAAGLGLAAFALVPAALAIRASNRYALASTPFWGLGLSPWPHRPIWPLGLLMPFFPASLGDELHSPVVSGGMGNVVEMGQGYFGAIGWVCALCVLRPGSRRSALTPVLAAVILFAIAEAAGVWPVAELVALLPGIRLMLPLRFYAWIPVAGAALAALEADRLVLDLRPRRGTRGVVAAAAFGSAALLVFLVFRREYVEAGQIPMQTRRLAVTLATLCALGVVMLLSRKRPKLLLPAVAAFAWLELAWQARGLHSFHPSELLYRRTGLTRFLADQQRPFRVLGAGAVLFPNTNVLAGVEDIRTHDPVERREYVEFLDATCGYDPKPYFKQVENLNASALDFLNVRFLLGAAEAGSPGPRWRPVYRGPDGVVFENRNVLPRAFVPRRIAYVQSSPVSERRRGFSPLDRDLARRLASNEDWADVAFVPGGRAGETNNARAEILEVRVAMNRAFVRVDAQSGAEPPLVVLSLVDDGGWSAREETGRALKVVPVNGPFLGVRAPSGRHAITLRYVPPGQVEGCVGSALTAAVAGMLLLRRRRRIRGPHGPPPASS
jgi:hypothetical protein